MSIEKSLQRLHWRISAGNNFKPNETDAQALNEIVNWVNASKENTIKENQLFGKLYIIYFGELLEHYKDLEMAQKTMRKSLSDSIIDHTEWFRFKLNNIENMSIYKELGLYEKPYYFQSKEELENEAKVIEENQIKFLASINKWTIEKVAKSLSNQITECINKYKNHD